MAKRKDDVAGVLETGSNPNHKTQDVFVSMRLKKKTKDMPETKNSVIEGTRSRFGKKKFAIWK